MTQTMGEAPYMRDRLALLKEMGGDELESLRETELRLGRRMAPAEIWDRWLAESNPGGFWARGTEERVKSSRLDEFWKRCLEIRPYNQPCPHAPKHRAGNPVETYLDGECRCPSEDERLRAWEDAVRADAFCALNRAGGRAQTALAFGIGEAA